MQLILYVLAIIASMTITAFTPEEIALYKDLFKGLEQFVSQQDFETALKNNRASRMAANYVLMLQEEFPNIKTSDDISSRYATALRILNYPGGAGKVFFESAEKDALEKIPEKKIITELTIAAFPILQEIPEQSRGILEDNKKSIAQEIRKRITRAKNILIKGIGEGNINSILGMSKLSRQSDNFQIKQLFDYKKLDLGDKFKNPVFGDVTDIQYGHGFFEKYMKDPASGLKAFFEKELPLRKAFYTNPQDSLDRTAFERSLKAKNIQSFVDLAIYKLYRQGRASTPEKLGLTQEQFDSVMTIGKLIDESLERMIRNYVIPAILIDQKREFFVDTIQNSYQIPKAVYAWEYNPVYRRLSRIYDQADILQNPEIIKRKKKIGAKKDRLADAKLLLSNLEIVKTESPAFAELAQKKIDEIKAVLGQDAQADTGKEEEFYKNPTLDELEKNTQLQASINVAMNSATKKIEATLNALKAIARSVNNPEEKEKLAEILEELNADRTESKLILQEAPKFPQKEEASETSTEKKDDPKAEKKDTPELEATREKESSSLASGTSDPKKKSPAEPRKEAEEPKKEPGTSTSTTSDPTKKSSPETSTETSASKETIEKKEETGASTEKQSPDLAGNLGDLLTDLAHALMALQYKLNQ